MTLFEIVALYGAINIIFLIALSYRVAGTRKKNSIGIGDGGDEALQRTIRVQGNFTEYTPMAIIGLLLMAGLNADPYWLHALGIAFTLGRVLHAIGFSGNSGVSFGRLAGMVLTWGSLLVMALYLLYKVIT